MAGLVPAADANRRVWAKPAGARQGGGGRAHRVTTRTDSVLGFKLRGRSYQHMEFHRADSGPELILRNAEHTLDARQTTHANLDVRLLEKSGIRINPLSRGEPRPAPYRTARGWRQRGPDAGD